MDKIWANRLVAGTKTWNECPDERKEAVRLELIRRIEIGDLTEVRYTEITGEAYSNG